MLSSGYDKAILPYLDPSVLWRSSLGQVRVFCFCLKAEDYCLFLRGIGFMEELHFDFNSR